jgi:hypothetical protein
VNAHRHPQVAHSEALAEGRGEALDHFSSVRAGDVKA